MARRQRVAAEPVKAPAKPQAKLAKSPPKVSTIDPRTLPMTLAKVKIKNESQQQYVNCLNEGKIIICNGPAGTGKTYLSTYIALEKYLNGEVRKIVITRPVVESGEKLGFLPGSLEEKINPYLKPILEAMGNHMNPLTIQQMLAENIIEISPLAYMRGVTFNDCFVILDEAENVTKEQMKMFLTRFGYGSTFLVNGDETQSDLPKHLENGLAWINRKLRPTEDILKMEFTRKDIVRHPIIEEILNQLDVPDVKETN